MRDSALAKNESAIRGARKRLNLDVKRGMMLLAGLFEAPFAQICHACERCFYPAHWFRLLSDLMGLSIRPAILSY